MNTEIKLDIFRVRGQHQSRHLEVGQGVVPGAAAGKFRSHHQQRGRLDRQGERRLHPQGDRRRLPLPREISRTLHPEVVGQWIEQSPPSEGQPGWKIRCALFRLW
jgi:hypothetical protein